MISLTIKGLSNEAHKALKQRAALNGRSLNAEAIAVLEASVRSCPIGPEGVIEKARRFRNSLNFRVGPSDLRQFKSTPPPKKRA